MQRLKHDWDCKKWNTNGMAKSDTQLGLQRLKLERDCKERNAKHKRNCKEWNPNGIARSKTQMGFQIYVGYTSSVEDLQRSDYSISLGLKVLLLQWHGFGGEGGVDRFDFLFHKSIVWALVLQNPIPFWVGCIPNAQLWSTVLWISTPLGVLWIFHPHKVCIASYRQPQGCTHYHAWP